MSEGVHPRIPYMNGSCEITLCQISDQMQCLLFRTSIPRANPHLHCICRASFESTPDAWDRPVKLLTFLAINIHMAAVSLARLSVCKISKSKKFHKLECTCTRGGGGAKVRGLLGNRHLLHVFKYKGRWQFFVVKY